MLSLKKSQTKTMNQKHKCKYCGELIVVGFIATGILLSEMGVCEKCSELPKHAPEQNYVSYVTNTYSSSSIVSATGAPSTTSTT